eukprot:scaffold20223_cov64-Attheya_sp.AAC.3
MAPKIHWSQLGSDEVREPIMVLLVPALMHLKLPVSVMEIRVNYTVEKIGLSCQWVGYDRVPVGYLLYSTTPVETRLADVPELEEVDTHDDGVVGPNNNDFDAVIDGGQLNLLVMAHAMLAIHALEGMVVPSRRGEDEIKWKVVDEVTDDDYKEVTPKPSSTISPAVATPVVAAM